MYIDLNAAIAFAARAHEGQTRKYTGAPYIVHPVEVMNIVRYVTHETDPEVLAAAVLHDVVEDTYYTHDDIRHHFGGRVSGLVEELTDVYTSPDYGNRAVRKALERTRQADISKEAQSIKVADLIANTHDIVAFDRGFGRIYIGEKADLLAVLTFADFRLRGVAQASLDAAETTLRDAL